MRHKVAARSGVKAFVLGLVATAAMIAAATVASARPPDEPKRIFYKTHSDSKAVVIEDDFHAPGDVVQVYYRCRNTAGAAGVLDVNGTPHKNLPCDDKIHWLRNVRVAGGERNTVTFGMYSGGTATVSIWGMK
jgi:hypothetical protein